MKKLLKEYGFETVEQYYEMTEMSFVNGQIKQAKEQFKAMPKDNQKDMVIQLGTPNGSYDFFFDLL
jgi:hypothetical protein